MNYSPNRFANHLLCDQNDRLIGPISNQKAKWYIRKKLVNVISDKPAYYLRLNYPLTTPKKFTTPVCKVKPNRCVVCGSEERICGHHIVPKCFLKFMPEKFKIYNSHDVMPICRDCHNIYELHAHDKKEEYCKQVNMGQHDYGLLIHETHRLTKLAVTYFDARINPRIQEVLRSKMKGLLGREVQEAEIAIYARMTMWHIRQAHKHFAQMVVENVKDLNEFAYEWRQHFIDKMQPKFMHLLENWRVDRKYALTD